MGVRQGTVFMNNKLLNVKYALINVFYFMLVCGTAGYANNFLKYRGFESSAIGIILTVGSIITLAVQTSIAPVIDRSDRINEKQFILITLFIALAGYVFMLFLPAGSILLLVFTVLGISFASIGVPFLNSLAFAYEQEGGKINYGACRGAGSAAYAVGGAVIGWLVALSGGADENIVSILPWYLAITDALCILVMFWMKDPQKAEKKEAAEKPQISYAAFFRKYKKIIPVVLALILIFFCHMLINTYMINVLQDIGGNTTDQGNAIFVQAMAELPTMFLFAALLKKVKVDWLMAFGAVMYVLKHLLVCFAPSIPVFFIGMIVQMFSYAIVVPGSVYFAAEHVEAEDRNKGQAIMSASLTAGQLLASFLGGILLQAMGVHAVLILGFVMTIAGAVIMLAGIRILKH